VGISYKLIRELDELKEAHKKDDQKSKILRTQRLLNNQHGNFIFQRVMDMKRGLTSSLHEQRILVVVDYYIDYCLQLKSANPDKEVIFISPFLQNLVKAKSQHIKYFTTVLDFVNSFHI